MVGCSAPNCRHNSRQKKYKFYRFPADEKRKAIWIKNCNRQNWSPTATSRLCNVHFDESQFEQHRLDGRKLLKPFAIPTIFKISNEPEAHEETSSNSCEITPFDLRSDLWDMKRFEDPFKDLDMKTKTTKSSFSTRKWRISSYKENCKTRAKNFTAPNAKSNRYDKSWRRRTRSSSSSCPRSKWRSCERTIKKGNGLMRRYRKVAGLNTLWGKLLTNIYTNRAILVRRIAPSIAELPRTIEVC